MNELIALRTRISLVMPWKTQVQAKWLDVQEVTGPFTVEPNMLHCHVSTVDLDLQTKHHL